MKTEIVYLSQIQVNGSNPRIIRDDKFNKLITSILVLPKMLELRPIVVDNTMVALGGNMRFRALTAIQDMDENELAQSLSESRDYQKKTEAEKQHLLEYWSKWKDKPTAPIIKASELTDEEQREFIIKDNVGYGEWDMDALANEWDTEELADWGLDELSKIEWDESDPAKHSTSNNASLFDRFVIPPFSTLDSRAGYWQDRKKQWREWIGDMGKSREGTLIKSLEMCYKDLYTRTQEHRKSLGVSFKEYIEKYVPEEVLAKERQKNIGGGVSLFDPVLSEIMCKWFTPCSGAKIFDCFAGDTQKGLVFAKCGFEFTGIELRQEQVDVNNEAIQDRDLPIKYICDDGRNVAKHFEPESQDLLFSCPPYFDLEVYSDLPNDASNQGDYDAFIDIIRVGFSEAIKCLKNNRFAVVVVGDVRNRANGSYYCFVDDIKKIFRDNGLFVYDDMILIENPATAAIRAGRYMDSRKVVKTHQNVLVFYKGDTKQINKEFPAISVTEEDMEQLKKIDEAYSEEQPDDSGSQEPTFQSDEDKRLNDLMKELVDFRKPYIKQGLIAYERYPQIKEAISDGDIHIVRNEETGKIDGYLWMNDLKRKPLSRIFEICSARKGLGRELIEMAIRIKKNDTLELYVVDYNDNAKAFYEHMGFVEVERETGKNVNNITMRYKGVLDK